jgi:hypothetical protein
MGLDVLIWGFGIAVFGVAARRAFDMITQERWRATWVWFFVSFVPLGAASQVWVAMNNPPPTVRWLILGIAGAALGATLSIAIGEAMRSVSSANAQGSPPPAVQPPVVNQGPGSAYSSGQQGGITLGTLNMGPVPRRVPPAQTNIISAALAQNKTSGIVEVQTDMMACPDCDGFATQLENVLRSAPGLTVKPIRNGMTITGFKGVALAVRNKSQLPPSVATVLNAFRAAGLELPVIEGQPNNADSDAVLIVAQPIT